MSQEHQDKHWLHISFDKGHDMAAKGHILHHGIFKQEQSDGLIVSRARILYGMNIWKLRVGCSVESLQQELGPARVAGGVLYSVAPWFI